MVGVLEEKQESVERRRESRKGRAGLSSYCKDGSFFFVMGATGELRGQERLDVTDILTESLLLLW